MQLCNVAVERKELQRNVGFAFAEIVKKLVQRIHTAIDSRYGTLARIVAIEYGDECVLDDGADLRGALQSDHAQGTMQLMQLQRTVVQHTRLVALAKKRSRALAHELQCMIDLRFDPGQQVDGRSEE